MRPAALGAHGALAAALLLGAAQLLAGSPAAALPLDGHVKAQGLLQEFDPDTFGAMLAGERVDLEGIDARLNGAWGRGSWDVSVQGQLVALYGDRLRARLDQGGGSGTGAALGARPDTRDARQALDLTRTLSEGRTWVALGRLDRCAVGFVRGPLAVRAGRQATSWGGGLVFQVLDLLDPFPPDAVDTEYKPGIDMLSAQWLFPGGDDLQAIVVPRRAGHSRPIQAEQSSAALKWSRFAGPLQLELLAARQRRDGVAGVGASGNLAGGVWRCDLATTFLDDGDPVLSGLVNFDRTWTWAGRNVEGFLELYRNGFGVTSFDGGLEALPPALVERLDRGEVFTAGRHEAAGGLRWEWTPLTTLEPTALVDLDGGSAYGLLQIHHEWRQDLEIDAGVQAPVGGRDSEYGGIRSAAVRAWLAPGRTVWLRVSRYFSLD